MAFPVIIAKVGFIVAKAATSQAARQAAAVALTVAAQQVADKLQDRQARKRGEE